MQEAKGLFITIEGLCGIRRGSFMTELQHALIKLGTDVEKIHFVSTSKDIVHGSRYSSLIGTTSYCHSPMISQYMLHLAIEEDILHNVVCPLLNKGHVVICDQFHDSTHAKFVHGHQKQIAGNHNGQLFAGQEFPSIQPDLTFVLDIEPLQALESTLSVESNRFSDSASLEFLVRTRNGLIKRAEGFPDRIKLLDASLPILDIVEQATAIVKNSIGQSS